MSEFSRETLLNIIETDHVQCGEASALARMALAAMDNEPVAWTWHYREQWHVTNDERRAEFVAKDGDVAVLPLYRHAQQPVVPEKATVGEMPFLGTSEGAYVRGWNDCRAAMLQENAKSAGVSNNCRSSENVQVMQDHQIRELVNQLRDIAVKYHAAGQLREQIARVIRAAMLQAGNSPVIPDGSADMLRRWLAFGRGMQNAGCQLPHNLIAESEAMLAASPHDTPALNSVQSVVTVPGKWIPVSEQMPPSRHEVLVGRWWGEKPRWCCKWATYIPGHPDAQSSGWLIPGASWTPTHWMPLPAAPQEVK